MSYLYHIKDKDLAQKQKEIPFQVRIHYSKPDGSDYLRVISTLLPTTSSRSQANSTCDVSFILLLLLYTFFYLMKVSVIGLAAVQLSASIAESKDYKSARDLLTATQRYLQQILQSGEDSPNYNTLCEEYVKRERENIGDY